MKSTGNLFAPVVPIAQLSLKQETGHALAPFEVYSLSHRTYSPIVSNDTRRRLHYFEVIWIQKGTGFLKIGDDIHRLSNGAIYCNWPGKLSTLLESSEELEGYYLSFSKEFLHQSAAGSAYFEELEIFNKAVHYLDPQQDDIRANLELAVRKMQTEMVQACNRRIDFLRTLLILFLLYFERIRPDPYPAAPKREVQLYKRFLGMIRKNIAIKKQVADYAVELNVTANYLNRTVKKVSGYPASYHIRQLIVQEAKRQAIQCGASMKEIAYSLGFDNLAHFSKYFKNNSGTNFSRFKKEAGRSSM